ncbi:hypothetical protein [Ruminococcus sp.]|uniref:hypothetical protein n=1 Tax=Ruminococcus TaxID=1263 RepID=UPI0011C18073
MCYASPDGQIFPERHNRESQGKSCVAAITRVQSAACNSVVLVTGKYPHHKYILRPAGLRRLTEQPKMWTQ